MYCISYFIIFFVLVKMGRGPPLPRRRLDTSKYNMNNTYAYYNIINIIFIKMGNVVLLEARHFLAAEIPQNINKLHIYIL